MVDGFFFGRFVGSIAMMSASWPPDNHTQKGDATAAPFTTIWTGRVDLPDEASPDHVHPTLERLKGILGQS